MIFIHFKFIFWRYNMSLKYVAYLDKVKNREFAIVFSNNISHKFFKKINPISAGIFKINTLDNIINIKDGSESLSLQPRYYMDEVLLMQTFKNTKYFIIADLDDFFMKSVFFFHNDSSFGSSFFLHPDILSEGNYDIFNMVFYNKKTKIDNDVDIMKDVLQTGASYL